MATKPLPHPTSQRVRSLVRRWALRLGAGLALLSALGTVWSYLRLQERNRSLDTFIANVMRDVDPNDTDAVVLTLSRAIYASTNRRANPGEMTLLDRLESRTFFNIGSAASLKYGVFAFLGDGGPCGTMSRLLLASLWRLGLPARKLHLFEHPTEPGSGHTMVEFFSAGRWQVISPSDSSFVWRNRSGRIATVEEIRTDPVIFRQVLAIRPQYPYTFDYPWHIRWSKLPQPIRALARAVLGEERYRNAQTPKLYDQPRLFFFLASLGILTLFMTLVWLLHRLTRSEAE